LRILEGKVEWNLDIAPVQVDTLGWKEHVSVEQVMIVTLQLDISALQLDISALQLDIAPQHIEIAPLHLDIAS